MSSTCMTRKIMSSSTCLRTTCFKPRLVLSCNLKSSFSILAVSRSLCYDAPRDDLALQVSICHAACCLQGKWLCIEYSTVRHFDPSSPHRKHPKWRFINKYWTPLLKNNWNILVILCRFSSLHDYVLFSDGKPPDLDLCRSEMFTLQVGYDHICSKICRR